MPTPDADAGHLSQLGLVRLLTWLSPGFPTGGFAYSHGLEWAVESGDVRDRATLLHYLRDIIGHGSGRSDVILLRLAYAAAGDAEALQRVAELARAAQPSRERQAEALHQGTAFLAAARAWGADAAEMTHAVAVGALAGRHGIGVEATAAAWLHAFCANLVSAAVRLVPLGQSDGLAVLAALEPQVLDVVADTRGATSDDVGGAAWRADIAAMLHETQHTRLFRS